MPSKIAMELVDNFKWSDGYDRNGSHEAGTYVEYVGRLKHYLTQGAIHALAEAIDAARVQLWQCVHTN